MKRGLVVTCTTLTVGKFRKNYQFKQGFGWIGKAKEGKKLKKSNQLSNRYIG